MLEARQDIRQLIAVTACASIEHRGHAVLVEHIKYVGRTVDDRIGGYRVEPVHRHTRCAFQQIAGRITVRVALVVAESRRRVRRILGNVQHVQRKTVGPRAVKAFVHDQDGTIRHHVIDHLPGGTARAKGTGKKTVAKNQRCVGISLRKLTNRTNPFVDLAKGIQRQCLGIGTATDRVHVRIDKAR